ncbi:NAD(P)/FAD-dependent oxidoreductase [Psychrobacter aestuarii]|uniref:NADP transhydrogenase subunit alpha n=1 Tax=Psychrobacter aestuarii TaxID=556327 RepID=A0ABN0VJW7_9GAMM|nr:NAD(P)-binding protein [Psychrobacter aestuarii]
MTDTDTTRIAIIGGGLTGLITAALLERDWATENKQKLGITIFEKSRGVGRMATRYRKPQTDSAEEWQWAMGVQSFSAKSDDFKHFIAPFIDANTLVPWQSRIAHIQSGHAEILADSSIDTPKHPCYISSPKMTSWGRAIAERLTHTEIQFKTRIAPLTDSAVNQQGKTPRTELYDEAGNSVGMFDWVICTAPNVQAAELFADTSFAAKDKISAPTMQACYTLMLGWQDKAHLPARLQDKTRQWSVLSIADGILDKIFIEHDKPEHGHLLPSVTIHADNAWSEAHVDEAQDVVRASLIKAVQDVLGWDAETAPTHIDMHRWRYAATTDNPLTPVPLMDVQKRWLVTGDWCGAGSIEACYQMAQASVTRVIQPS